MGMPAKPRGRNGKRNQREGAQFEHIFAWTCKTQGFGVEQLPKLGARFLGKNKVIKVPMPFDCLVYKNGITAFLDTKSFNTNNLIFSYLDQNQTKALMNAHERNIPAGYVVWHRPQNKVVFYKANILISLRPQDSINSDEGTLLGGVENFNIARIFSGSFII